MSDPQILLQGLSISISGLLITFLSLGTFILVISLLQRIFPVHAPKEDIKDESASIIQEVDSNELEIAAAISSALCYWRSQQKSALGKELENGRGSFWKAAPGYAAKPVMRINRSKQ